jgi:hypothetical protein
MKPNLRALLITAILIEPATGADARGLFILDEPGMNCIFSDNGPGTITFYLFHEHPCVTGSQFRIEPDPGFTGVLLSYAPAPGFLAIGDITIDYAVSYGGIEEGMFPIASATYQVFGTSASCSRIHYRAVPNSPIPGEVVVFPCVHIIEAERNYYPPP